MSKQPTKPTPTVDTSKKMSGELFTLTYGALVAQLLHDCDQPAAVNRQLDKIGYNMGCRMVDDLFAKMPSLGKCSDLREIADVLAKHAFRIYLGVTPTVTNWNASADEFSLVFDVNPLTEFVELPGDQPQLRYSQVLCGAIRGALETVHMDVTAELVREHLLGDATTEIRVHFKRRLQEAVPAGDD